MHWIVFLVQCVALDDKMNLYLVVTKKTPFQNNREEEEATKKRAHYEATRLYEEFVKSFKTYDVPSGKAFVRGETIDPNERLKTGNEGLCQSSWYT